MVKSKAHDEIIESFCDFRKGWTNMKSASKELAAHGFDPDIAKVLLKSFKHNNITQIRGYSKEPAYLLKSKIGTSRELKKK